jgi:hypothetical protein
MIPNTYTHSKDCPDRKEAAADRKTHDTRAKVSEQRLQLLAHAEWYDSGPVHAPSHDRDSKRLQPAPLYEDSFAEPILAPPTISAPLRLWTSLPPAA